MPLVNKSALVEAQQVKEVSRNLAAEYRCLAGVDYTAVYIRAST